MLIDAGADLNQLLAAIDMPYMKINFETLGGAHLTHFIAAPSRRQQQDRAFPTPNDDPLEFATGNGSCPLVASRSRRCPCSAQPVTERHAVLIRVQEPPVRLQFSAESLGDIDLR